MATPPPVENQTLTLQRAVSIAARLAPARSVIGSASYVLLEPSDEGIKVTATDLDSRVELVAEGSIDHAVLVDGRLLNRVLRTVPESTVKAIPRSRQLVVEGGGYHFELNGWDPTTFPPAPVLEGEPQRVPFDVDAFRWCGIVAAGDDSRPLLTGVALYRPTGAMVASDGFRLKAFGAAWVPWHNEEDAGPDGAPNTTTIPARVARHMPPDVHELEVYPAHVRVRGAYDLITKPILGAYPRFATLIPVEETWSATVDAADFRRALGVLIEVARDGSGIVRIQAEDGMLALSARAEEIAEVKVLLEAEITGAPRVAINGLFCRDAIAGAHEKVRIGGKDPSSQLTFDSVDGRRDVVMPMFVQW